MASTSAVLSVAAVEGAAASLCCDRSVYRCLPSGAPPEYASLATRPPLFSWEGEPLGVRMLNRDTWLTAPGQPWTSSLTGVGLHRLPYLEASIHLT